MLWIILPIGVFFHKAQRAKPARLVMERVMEKESAWREFETLPEETKREVIDFIAFLKTRSQKSNLEKRPKKLKLSEEPFVGIWKDRKDLNDSVAWVRELRKNEWAR